LLEGALATLECRTFGVFEAGDHDIVVGEVLAMSSREDAEPLVYYGRRYHRLGERVDEQGTKGHA
jgi:flavin reductase (DIM6/NTAB) family NADH-FMN oxidoreductase RutF